ncbi:MAG TPA: DUF1003 domain-containing protein, partial [Phycisphaerae bacterium]|nr:DUF1003 domain-containing protein [Phycisphaerae bacterium]
MADMRNQTIACQVCGQSKRPSELMPAELVRPAVAELIRKEHPDWSHGSYICLEDLNHFRTAYVEDMLETERGELSSLEEQVLRSLKEQEVLTTDINVEFDRKLTFGERLADRVADFGGSWGFILIFASVLLTWIVINSVALLKQPFDPYPYILLNLVLSCLAAIQAPVIMMSQNRQEAKDRLRGEHDYRVNLKAELEIRHLNAKMDQLLTHQWRRLMEIQQIQMDLMEEFMGRSA